MRMETCRWTELLQMLEVATTGSHAVSQALGEVCHHLVNVDVFMWQLFPVSWPAGRLSTYQSSRASAEVCGTFPARSPRRNTCSPAG